MVPLLPRKVCYRLSNFFGFLAAHLDRAGRRVAIANLEAAFGNDYSASQRGRIATRSYQYFARTMFDLFWSTRLTRENFRQWIDVENLREVVAKIGPDRSFIFFTVHYGNFETAAAAVGFSGVRLLIMAQGFKNQLLDRIFAHLRQHSGHQLTDREGGVIRMFKALKRGRSIALLSDLTLRPAQPSVIIECFGLKTCVTFAHAWLHQKTGAPLVPAYCEALPGGKNRLVVQAPLEIPPDATETEIAQACWDRFEPLMRKDPSPWLWMYKQFRYKPANADRPYPFYSNDSEEFDAMLARLSQKPAAAASK